ncbi:MAG: filamentous hemagglutinin N-terminal domain-containing protein, partial [Nitrosomonadales bacterium]|nr:filamentous hemagglutinin N-terminal domain-containing protein [Nitrosomonadales bacterium]
MSARIDVRKNIKQPGEQSWKRGFLSAALFIFFGSAQTFFIFLGVAQAAPTGGQISAGAGAISQAGANTTITQSSQNLAIDWLNFSIGSNEAVRFNQPNSASIALNRVTTQNPSQILGSLNANGQVFLLNPNGVLFGSTAQVNVGGLVASTLGLGNSDFMAGRYSFSNAVQSGSVVNQGVLNAANGGYIAMLAPEVRNEGVVSATLGTALLAAGDKITLNLNNGSLLSYSADQGSLKALVENKQLIQADGGQVYMSAKAADLLSTAVVNNTGVVEARTLQNRNGTIMLLGDMQAGQVNVGGTLDASAANGGNGGFIETSAAHVKVAADAKITTQAAQGKSGNWLIDPADYTIAATGGDITGAALATNLATTNVTILSSQGTVVPTLGNGDIFVNDIVSWNSLNSLTLSAIRNINVNSAVTNAGTGAINLTAAAAVAINANISAAGAVAITAPTGLTQAATTTITTGTGLTANVSAASPSSGVIAGAGGLTKTGTGTLTLSGANTYSGVTTINGGILSVGTIGNGLVAGNLGAASNVAGNLILGGGTLQYTGATAATDRAYTLTAGTTSSIDVATAASTLTMSGAGALTTGGLTKVGAGTLALTGANAYTGATTINAGTLSVNGAAIADTSAVTVGTGATLALTGSETIGSLSGAGNVTLGALTLTAGGDNTSTTYS